MNNTFDAFLFGVGMIIILTFASMYVINYLFSASYSFFEILGVMFFIIVIRAGIKEYREQKPIEDELE